MPDQNSVTRWLEDLKQGDDEAATHLWERYFQKLVHVARQKLGCDTFAAGDAEDVALSVFDRFCRGATDGNFADLSNRGDLWRLLLTITYHKSIDRARWEKRVRRGGGKVLRESELSETEQVRSIDDLISRGPTPDFLALMDEKYIELLSRLRDDTLREIVQWKLSGHTNDEIAEFLDVSVHTVGRKLRLIRWAWSKELEATD